MVRRPKRLIESSKWSEAEYLEQLISPPAQDTILAEFVKLYPNPTQQLVNLVFSAKTSGVVSFDLFDALGATVMHANLADGENFAQYSISNLANGIYHWRLKDSDRVIKSGKLAIMKWKM